MKKKIGKIYQSNIQHVGDGHYRFTLIGVISPKKASVIRYDIRLQQEEEKNKNDKPTIKISLSKEFYKDCKLNITCLGTGNKYEITTGGDNQMIFDYFDKTLNFLVCFDSSYMESALETIGEQVIEKYYGESFMALGSAISDSLIGTLMTKNQLKSALGLTKKIDGQKNLNLARVISRTVSALKTEYKYISALDIIGVGEKYIKILEKIFEKFGIDSYRLETPLDYARRLEESPMLVYEYLLNLTPKEIVEFADEIASLYEELKTVCITNKIDNKAKWRFLDDKRDLLVSAITAYKQIIASIWVEGDKLMVTRREGHETAVLSDHVLTQTITERRVLEGLKNSIKNIPPKLGERFGFGKRRKP